MNSLVKETCLHLCVMSSSPMYCIADIPPQPSLPARPIGGQ